MQEEIILFHCRERERDASALFSLSANLEAPLPSCEHNSSGVTVLWRGGAFLVQGSILFSLFSIRLPKGRGFANSNGNSIQGAVGVSGSPLSWPGWLILLELYPGGMCPGNEDKPV